MIWIVVCLVSCASLQDPVRRVVNSAEFSAQAVHGNPFTHKIYANDKQAGEVVHVYIGGDGTPWLMGIEPATDPTPRNPLALRLMAQDKNNAIFLGRPCFFGLNDQVECVSGVWTHGRYSSVVVDSMGAALHQALPSAKTSGVVLIGYSGGAVIATLLAQRLEGVVALVTVAGNLDTDLWTETLGLLPLRHSLNPVSMDGLRTDILQVHLIGEQDPVVPNAITRSFTDRHGGTVWNYPEFDHRCCWESEWSKILDQIASMLDARRSNARK